jgi:uncharacterized alpha-E superfamily protein
VINDEQAIRLDQIEENGRIRLSKYSWSPYLNSGMPESTYLRRGPEYMAAFNVLVALDLLLNHPRDYHHIVYDWSRLQDNLEYLASPA